MQNHLVYITTLILSFTSIALSAQKTDSVTTNQPSAIPLIELVDETQATRQKVSRAMERVLTESNIEEVTREFDRAKQDFNEALSEYEVFRTVTPNKLKLDNYIRVWRSLNDARDRWRSAMSTFMNRASVSRETLEFEKERWQLTRLEAVDSGAPTEVITSIDNTLMRLNSALDEVDSQLDTALTISAVITEQQSRINEVITDLERWGTSGELNVFYQRHPPIWQTNFGNLDSSSTTTLQSPDDHAHAIGHFYRNFSWPVNIYFFFSLLIIAFINYLKQRLKKVDLGGYTHPSISRIRSVISEHTGATALYFVAVFALFYLRNMPSLIEVIFLFLMLLTSAILLRPFTLPRFKWLITFIIVAFVIESLKSYIWFSSLGYRVYMYIEALYCFLVALYFIRNVGLSDIKKTVINKTFKIGAWLIVLLSIAAIIANTLGYTNLSDVLLRIGIMGASLTVLAYGILFVLGGVVGTTLSIYFAEHSELDAKASDAILQKTQVIAKWLAAVLWLVFILTSAELYRPLFNALELWLTEPWIIGDFSLTPGALLSFILVIIVAFVLARAVAVLIDSGALAFTRISKGTLAIISMLVRYFIVVLALAIALGTLGIDMSKFGLVAGALGVGIGFGLQNIVSNFISGMILTFEQPLSTGDTIEVNGLMGVVQKIGVRSSTIRSFDGADIIIPNATLLSNDLINWTRVDDQRRIEINVGVAYGSNPPKVRQILLQIVHDHPQVLFTPEPAAFFNQFGDSALNFRLLFWAPIGEWLDVQSQVASEIHKRFKEEGIEIPFPQQDVWIRNAREETAAKNAGDEDAD